MFDHILLEPEQIELLRIVVEASRSVPSDQRRKFYVSRTLGGDLMMHPGLDRESRQTYMHDIEVLGNAGLLNLGYGSGGSPNFDVTPLGFRYYAHLHSEDADPVRTVEQIPLKYIATTSFVTRYPNAYAKWLKAEQLLWKSDSTEELTAIGHFCREAMQEFATVLVQLSNVPSADPDIAHVVARVRAVVGYSGQQLGDTSADFYSALIGYWGTLSDLVQRQEHGAQREGQPLVWLDGRRIVFHTALLMFELDTVLLRGR